MKPYAKEYGEGGGEGPSGAENYPQTSLSHISIGEELKESFGLDQGVIGVEDPNFSSHLGKTYNFPVENIHNSANYVGKREEGGEREWFKLDFSCVFPAQKIPLHP